jgi:aminopeptidase N
VNRRPVAAAVAAVLVSSLMAGCSDDEKDPAGQQSPPSTSGTPTVTATIADDGDDGPQTDDPALDIALSTPVEDSIYPDMGDPSVDALHYDLDLAWTPGTRILDGIATIVLRSTRDGDHLQLDLGASLEVTSATLDGKDVEYEHEGKNLVVNSAVAKDARYVLAVHYSGTPKPTASPTTRSDFSTGGWAITDDGETWTMQEPYGAFTWYPVNDQPADKALYDFNITVPSPWVGIANGELTDRTEDDGLTTTTWHTTEPMSSYLVTVATGDYTQTTNTTDRSGFEISYWVPTDRDDLTAGLHNAAGALEWLEAKLGPFPFDSLGFLLVENQSGMETQTMITLGITEYTMSTPVLLHEMVHQWYGDEVTPDDWRDMWMNEGMAMYLQGVWTAEQEQVPLDQLMDEWAEFESDMRRESGPPGNYDPAQFGEGNVYYGPALMWHELRKRLGDDEFFRIVREWPESRSNKNSNREDYLAWIEEQTGEELTSFFDAWLLGEKTPPRA